MTPLLLLTPFDPDGAPSDTSGTVRALTAALRRSGRAVVIADLDRVRLRAGRLEASDTRGAPVLVDDARQGLILGFGDRRSCLDRFQMLAATKTQWITSPPVMLQAHSKIGLHALAAPWPVPEYEVGRGSDLATTLASRAAEGWLCKPTAASHGDGVVLLPRRPEAMRARLSRTAGMVIVQRRVPGTERRLLFAGGRFIGQYVRKPAATTAPGIAGNLARGAVAVAAPPCDEEAAARAALGERLLALGIGWAGVDLKGDHLLEVNVVNPGGLATLAALGDAAEAAADAVCAAFAALLD